jgi:hypothetical protein
LARWILELLVSIHYNDDPLIVIDREPAANATVAAILTARSRTATETIPTVPVHILVAPIELEHFHNTVAVSLYLMSPIHEVSQNADGSISIHEVLYPNMGGQQHSDAQK